MSAPLWKVAVSRFMGWSPEQGRQVEAEMRAVADRARREPVAVAAGVVVAFAAATKDFVEEIIRGEEKNDGR